MIDYLHRYDLAIFAYQQPAKPLALWANSTLGLMSFWWIGTRQQRGRAMLQVTRLPELLALDCRALTAGQIAWANDIFDAAILCDLLGLPESILEPLRTLRLAWCEEPTVHGGKSTRPGGTR